MSHNNCTTTHRPSSRLDTCPKLFGCVDASYINACYLCDELSDRYICQSCEALCALRNRSFLDQNLVSTGHYPQLLSADFDCLLVLDWYQYPWTTLVPLLKFHKQAQIGKVLGTWFVLYRMYRFYDVATLNNKKNKIVTHTQDNLAPRVRCEDTQTQSALYLTSQHLPEAMVPIPLHPKRERQRGYNQALLIAETISELTGIPVVTDAVQRSQYTKAQTELDREHRLANLADAFSVSLTKLGHYSHIALVDDVLTTGSTLNTVCNALYKQYPRLRISVWCMTIAVDDTVVEEFCEKHLDHLQ
ncbi:ComF family protein [Opacimonas viscosa]|uniref:ComF family protein n=1 Tax=Opacimonas viscosa TaxID=2961944 RepID=A0AA41WZJ7_9ALTE|nr:phosphoribosyltransferase family protein [Opacimonas viscosa]MCP3429000.1 hypothetical protein [Opacimonas viscosa]